MAHADMCEDPGPTATAVRDLDDAYLVAIAEATGALLVTGDQDLLAADLEPAAITPAQLLNLL